MKDNFSHQSKEYAKYRPTYPDELINFLVSFTSDKQCAWDCGTGNGQIAVKLSNYFKQVFATDISEKQISNAPKISNIKYKVEPAESTKFKDNMFDLITVAQAIHWFDFDKYYQEVKRTLKQDGIIAVVGYSLPKISPDVDKVIYKFYSKFVGDLWDKERDFIDKGYTTIPFPFKEISAPPFKICDKWTFENLIGYLNTWSATQHYIRERNENPVDKIEREIQINWGNNKYRNIIFPILLRIGKNT